MKIHENFNLQILIDPVVEKLLSPGNASNLTDNDNLRILVLSRWRNRDTRITQKANM